MKTGVNLLAKSCSPNHVYLPICLPLMCSRIASNLSAFFKGFWICSKTSSLHGDVLCYMECMTLSVAVLYSARLQRGGCKYTAGTERVLFKSSVQYNGTLDSDIPMTHSLAFLVLQNKVLL